MAKSNSDDVDLLYLGPSLLLVASIESLPSLSFLDFFFWGLIISNVIVNK